MARKAICKTASDILGKIVNIKINTTKSNGNTKIGTDLIASYEIGNNVNTSEKVFGSDDALFTININPSKNLFDSTIGISTNNKNINISLEKGLLTTKISGSMRKGDMVATHSFGNENFKMLYEFGLDIDSGIGVSDNVYAKGGFNSLLLAPIPIWPKIKNSIPVTEGVKNIEHAL